MDQLRQIIREEIRAILSEGLRPANLSFSDVVEMNSDLQSGKVKSRIIDTNLYNAIKKKFFARASGTITGAAKAKKSGRVNIHTTKGSSTEISIMGNYLVVKNSLSGKSQYFEIT